jgi:hypothetical protein
MIDEIKKLLVAEHGEKKVNRMLKHLKVRFEMMKEQHLKDFENGYVDEHTNKHILKVEMGKTLDPLTVNLWLILLDQFEDCDKNVDWKEWVQDY